MVTDEENSNISEIVNRKTKRDLNKIYFGVFDARDSSLIPLQLVLFALACVETVEGVLNIVDPGDSIHPHVYAQLGSYTLAYASALFAIAFRPARARGLLILVTIAAIGFVATSILDVARGRAELSGEIEHATKLLAPFVVWIIASRVVTFSKPRKKAQG